jgi:leader peptidase (prepilin peptidase)/N-methyltransferase
MGEKPHSTGQVPVPLSVPFSTGQVPVPLSVSPCPLQGKDAMWYVLVFFLGLIVGSFLNVCIQRIPVGQSVVYPPSRCNACGGRLLWFHMIPVASYMFLKGKCGFCGERISPLYPAVELITAALFTAACYRLGPGVLLIKGIVLISLVVAVSVIDLKEQVIPDNLIVFGLSAGIAFIIIDGGQTVKDALLGALAGGGILLAIVLISTGGHGGGDVKLMTAIGLLLGWRLTLVALFVSFVTGGSFGVMLLLAGKKGRKDKVPFGPFLGGSSIVSYFFGQQMISLYFSVF